MSQLRVNIEEIQDMLDTAQEGAHSRLATVEHVLETIAVFKLWSLVLPQLGLDGEPRARHGVAAVRASYSRTYGHAACTWINVGPNGVDVARGPTPGKDRPKWSVSCPSPRVESLTALRVGRTTPTWSKRLGLRWSWWKFPF